MKDPTGTGCVVGAVTRRNAYEALIVKGNAALKTPALQNSKMIAGFVPVKHPWVAHAVLAPCLMDNVLVRKQPVSPNHHGVNGEALRYAGFCC